MQHPSDGSRAARDSSAGLRGSLGRRAPLVRQGSPVRVLRGWLRCIAAGFVIGGLCSSSCYYDIDDDDCYYHDGHYHCDDDGHHHHHHLVAPEDDEDPLGDDELTDAGEREVPRSRTASAPAGRRTIEREALRPLRLPAEPLSPEHLEAFAQRLLVEAERVSGVEPGPLPLQLLEWRAGADATRELALQQLVDGRPVPGAGVVLIFDATGALTGWTDSRVRAR